MYIKHLKSYECSFISQYNYLSRKVAKCWKKCRIKKSQRKADFSAQSTKKNL